MKTFFQPESVTFVCSTEIENPRTNNSLEMMLRSGYEGNIFPVHPKAEKICGLKAYSSVAKVPVVADLAIIAVDRGQVFQTFKDCIQSGVRSVVIIACQSLMDAYQNEHEIPTNIARLACKSGVRVVGPNSLGVMNNFDKFSSGFIDISKSRKVLPVSFVTQANILNLGHRELAYHNWGKFIDIGNACDVDFVDAIEYFADDPKTKVIVLLMESISRVRKFLKTASKVSFKKPIIIMKTKRTKE